MIAGLIGGGIVFTGISWLALFPLRWCLARWQVVDIPNERSSHKEPTSRGGGSVIVLITLIGLAIWRQPIADGLRPKLLICGIGAAFVAAVSWLDDLRSLPSLVRLLAQSLGALLVIASVGYWQRVGAPFCGVLWLGWLGIPITFVWIVGLTNAYNFMDGIDGIAGGQAVVAGFGWAVLGELSGQPLVSVLGMLLAAGSAGFLGHNWPPARIFMGDVGSAFLGFSFAVLPIMAAARDPALALAGVLMLWPFLFDTIFTFLRRLCRGENVFAAHRSHLYQRLVISGLSHRTVTSCYIGLALCGLGFALARARSVPGSAIGPVVFLPLLCLALWSYVVYREQKIRAQGPSYSTLACG